MGESMNVIYVLCIVLSCLILLTTAILLLIIYKVWLIARKRDDDDNVKLIPTTTIQMEDSPYKTIELQPIGESVAGYPPAQYSFCHQIYQQQQNNDHNDEESLSEEKTLDEQEETEKTETKKKRRFSHLPKIYKMPMKSRRYSEVPSETTQLLLPNRRYSDPKQMPAIAKLKSMSHRRRYSDSKVPNKAPIQHSRSRSETPVLLKYEDLKCDQTDQFTIPPRKISSVNKEDLNNEIDFFSRCYLKSKRSHQHFQAAEIHELKQFSDNDSFSSGTEFEVRNKKKTLSPFRKMSTSKSMPNIEKHLR